MESVHPLLAPWTLPRWYTSDPLLFFARGGTLWPGFEARDFTSRRMRRLVRHCHRRSLAWRRACRLPNGVELVDQGEARRWWKLANRCAFLLHMMRAARLDEDSPLDTEAGERLAVIVR